MSKKPKNETYVIEVDDWERRLLLGCLNTARNTYLEQDKPVEDVCVLLENVIKAPTRKEKKKYDRAQR